MSCRERTIGILRSTWNKLSALRKLILMSNVPRGTLAPAKLNNGADRWIAGVPRGT